MKNIFRFDRKNQKIPKLKKLESIFEKRDQFKCETLSFYDLRGESIDGTKFEGTNFWDCEGGLSRLAKARNCALIFFLFAIVPGFSIGYWAAALGSQFVGEGITEFEASQNFTLYASVTTLVAIACISTLFLLVLRSGVKSKILLYVVPSVAIFLGVSAVVMGWVSGDIASYVLTLTMLCTNTVIGVVALSIGLVTLCGMSLKVLRGIATALFLLPGAFACFIEVIVSMDQSQGNFSTLLIAASPLASFIALSFTTICSYSLMRPAIKNNLKHIATKNLCSYWASRSGTQFKGKLYNVSFRATDLSNVDFSQVDRFWRVDWGGAVNLEWAYFNNSSLPLGLICGVPTHSKKVINLITSEKEMILFDKFGSDFSKLNLRGVNLNGRNLSNINFSEAIFDEGDFSDAIFKNSTLTAISARKAIFDKADLTNADFSNSFLGGAEFGEAIITGAYFTRTLIDENTVMENVHCEHLFIGTRKVRIPSEGSFEPLQVKEMFISIQNAIRRFLLKVDSSPNWQEGSGYFALDYLLHYALENNLTVPNIYAARQSSSVVNNTINITDSNMTNTTLVTSARDVSSNFFPDQT